MQDNIFKIDDEVSIALKSKVQKSQVEYFLNRDKYHLQHITLVEVNFYLGQQIDPSLEVFAIIDPDLTLLLDYNLVRRVARVTKIDDDRKQWYADYWKRKHGAKLHKFGKYDHEVGLEFDNNVYDFPGNILTFVVRSPLEGN